MVYLQTRTSTCLWKGGCRIFAILYLIQPIIFVIAILFIDTILTIIPENRFTSRQRNVNDDKDES